MSQSNLPKGFLWGFATARFVLELFLQSNPAVESTETVGPSHAEFETTVTRLKARLRRTAEQTLSGTLSVAFQARLQAEIRAKWPVTLTTALPKILTS